MYANLDNNNQKISGVTLCLSVNKKREREKFSLQGQPLVQTSRLWDPWNIQNVSGQYIGIFLGQKQERSWKLGNKGQIQNTIAIETRDQTILEVNGSNGACLPGKGWTCSIRFFLLYMFYLVGVHISMFHWFADAKIGAS